MGDYEERDGLGWESVVGDTPGRASRCWCYRDCGGPDDGGQVRVAVEVRLRGGSQWEQPIERERAGEAAVGLVDDNDGDGVVSGSERSVDGKRALIGAFGGERHVAEPGFVAVVVAVDFVGHETGNLLDGIGRAPEGCHVEPIAAEDAEDVSLRDCAVDVFLTAPVVFRERELGAGVVFGDP